MRKLSTINYQLSIIRSAAILLSLLTFMACNEPVYTPRPRAYPKVVYPERAFQQYGNTLCDFTFEYPTYAEVVTTNKQLGDDDPNPCWFDLFVTDFDCRLHCTYYPVTDQAGFTELMADAFDMANNHNLRANYIDEIQIQKENNVSGFIFDIEGPAASPFQFYLTDSTDHFFRGALYFNTQIKEDSLAPLYDFLKKDIFHLIETFEWENAL